MSKATPEAVQAVFHPDSLRDEVAHLNSLLTDSHITTCALFQLLDSNGIHVGSTELIKAREKVEAEREALKLKVLELSADAARVRCSNTNKEKLCPDEMQALRTANAGLVEKVAELQSWKDQQLQVESEWNPNELAELLGAGLGESQRAVIQREVPKLVEGVKRLEKAGDRLADWLRCDTNPSSVKWSIDQWDKAKGQP